MSLPFATTVALSKSVAAALRSAFTGGLSTSHLSHDASPAERLLDSDPRAFCAGTRFVGWDRLSLEPASSATSASGAILALLPWGPTRLTAKVLDHFDRPRTAVDLATATSAAPNVETTLATLVDRLTKGESLVARCEPRLGADGELSGDDAAVLDALEQADDLTVLVPWLVSTGQATRTITIDRRPWRTVAAELLQRDAAAWHGRRGAPRAESIARGGPR